MIALAVVAVALSVAVAGVVAALRARAHVAGMRVALRLALAREAALLESTRSLAEAARRSVADVRAELARALAAIAPAIDAVATFEEREGALECVAAIGERLEHYAGTRVALDDAGALVACALRAGHRAVLGETPGARPLHAADVAAIATPIGLHAGRGAAWYVAARRRLDAGTVERIVTLLDAAAPAYSSAYERESDRQRAEFDGLTGLLTPSAFRRALTLLVDRAPLRRPPARLALLFVDTDRFKQWNDTYGHASGDALLRALAACLRATAQPGDAVGRNGGDEFCLALAECEKSTAIERADALRAAIAALDFAALRPAGATADVRISASIGVAAFPHDAATPGDLLERADAAMYHAKHAGRDAVAFAGIDGEFRVVERSVVRN